MKRSQELSCEAQASDPLTALIRAAVRAEIELLRAELAGRPEVSRPAGRLKIAEAANALRCSTRQVRRLISAGRLRAAKLGSGGSSRILIDRSEIDRLLAEART